MHMSGICGTDKHTYQGYTTQYSGAGDGKKIPFPIIQGHENVSTVAAIGGDGHYDDFEGIPLKAGDRVVVGANVCCGKCYYCTHDFPYYFCQNMTDYGNNLSAADPPHSCPSSHVAPKSVSYEVAGLQVNLLPWYSSTTPMTIAMFVPSRPSSRTRCWLPVLQTLWETGRVSDGMKSEDPGTH